MPEGTIVRLLPHGVGFIRPEQGDDLSFNMKELEGIAFNNLRQGQKVEFEQGRGQDGRPTVTGVKLAGNQPTITGTGESVDLDAIYGG